MALASAAQQRLFDAVCACGKLIFACGVEGVSANLVGRFSIERYGNEDRLDVGDGEQHVHIDWSQVQQVHVDTFMGEGRLLFLTSDGRELFKIYCPEGPFPEQVAELGASL